MAYPLRTTLMPRDWFLWFVLSIMSLLDTVMVSNVYQESRNGSVAVSNVYQESRNGSVAVSNVYQVVVNRSVTVPWNSNVSLDLSSVCLLCLKDMEHVLVDVWNGVETADAQDPQFTGRFQWNITKEGHVQLNMFRLRTEDNGTYWCKLFLWDGRIIAYESFVLNVTSGLTHEEQQDAVTTDYWVWVLVLVLVLVLMVLAVVLIHKHNRRKRNEII